MPLVRKSQSSGKLLSYMWPSTLSLFPRTISYWISSILVQKCEALSSKGKKFYPNHVFLPSWVATHENDFALSHSQLSCKWKSRSVTTWCWLEPQSDICSAVNSSTWLEFKCTKVLHLQPNKSSKLDLLKSRQTLTIHNKTDKYSLAMKIF